MSRALRGRFGGTTSNELNPDDISDRTLQTGANGLDGEVDSATNLLDAGYESDELVLEQNIPATPRDTEIDIGIEIDPENRQNNIAIQVKNSDYSGGEVPPEVVINQNGGIRDILEGYAQNRYTVVLASRTNTYGEAFEALKDDLESQYGVEVRYVNIDQIGELDR